MQELRDEDISSFTKKLSADMKAAAARLRPNEARFLVDSYYQRQDARIAAANQGRSLKDQGEPSSLVDWISDVEDALETRIKQVLEIWSDAHPAGRWMKSNVGVGPCLAAGFLAYIDIRKAVHVSAIWRLAGLDPTRPWLGREKARELVTAIDMTPEGIAALAAKVHVRAERLVEAATDEGRLKRGGLEKYLARRPWNATLKLLAWKFSDSMVKRSSHPDAFYGRLYVQFKAAEVQRDIEGRNAECAARTLLERSIRDAETRRIYESGHLPAGRIDLRARRRVAKVFLQHLYLVWRQSEGLPVTQPWAVAHGGHGDIIAPPNWPLPRA